MESFEANVLKMMVNQHGLQKVKSFLDDLEKEEPVKGTLQPKERFKKFTAKHLEALENAFANSNTIIVDKLVKDKFKVYINNLDEETFAANDLAHHAQQFAQTEKDTATTTTSAKPKKFTKRNKVESVTYEKLKEMSEHLSKVENAPAGTFLNTVTNKFVTGPEEPENEEVTEVTFNDKEYHVGDISYRVYEVIEGSEEGEFCGYYGIDEFKEMVKN